MASRKHHDQIINATHHVDLDALTVIREYPDGRTIDLGADGRWLHWPDPTPCCDLGDLIEELHSNHAYGIRMRDLLLADARA